MLAKQPTTESGHWYDQQGNPAYTTIGANGKERNTTLRDAKKHNLLPSVTTILSIAAKPGLQQWLQQQVLLAALTLPRLEDETEDDWIARIIDDSKTQSRQAAERGTHIHGIIEAFYSCEYLPEKPIYLSVVEQMLNEEFNNPVFVPEKSFAHPLGFGGKVDLHTKADVIRGYKGLVVDVKTTEKDVDSLSPYHEHEMQLAAYRQGLGIPEADCAILFVNATQNKAKICRIGSDDLQNAWECFSHLLAFYKIKNNL